MVWSGPVVFVAVLWSWWGSVQSLRTDPRQKNAVINGDHDLQASDVDLQFHTK